MKKLLGVVLVSFALSANAVEPSMIAHGQNVTVRLFDRPCEVKEVLELLKPEFHARYRAGSSELNGEHRELCWLAFPERGVVVVVDDHGVDADLDMTHFKKEEGV